MKIMILECTEEELKANRGIMDDVTDALHGFLTGFYGTYYNPDKYTADDTADEEESEGEQDV